jgi:N-acetylneuraminic acid mutarotase
MPTPRWQSSAGLIGGQIYVEAGYNPAIGGHITQVEAYDPATDSWVSLSPQPFQQDSGAYAVINGILYVAGGANCCVGIAMLSAYDPASNSWTTLASLPEAEEFPAADTISGLLYVAGVPDAATGTATLNVYDPGSGVWTAMTPMPTPRFSPAACAINGIIYVVGGNDTSGNALNTVEAYDPAIDSWSTKASLPTPRTRLAVAELNGILYAIGGASTSGGNAVIYNTVEAYNPALDVWTEQPTMPTARASLEAVVANNSIYAIGGYVTGEATALSTVEAFTPSPSLYIAAAGNQSVIYWSASFTNYVLQTTTNLSSPKWVAVSNGVPIIGVTLTNALPAAFFRLQQQ